jgi:hypothetical protein
VAIRQTAESAGVKLHSNQPPACRSNDLARGFILDNRFNTALVVIGIGVCLATGVMEQDRYRDFESRQITLLDGIVRASIELEAIEGQLRDIAQTRATLAQDQPQMADRETIARLAVETEQLTSQLQVKAKLINDLSSRSNTLKRDARIGLWSSVLGLSLGALLSLSGILGWIFRVKVIRDRRVQARADDAPAT